MCSCGAVNRTSELSQLRTVRYAVNMVCILIQNYTLWTEKNVAEHLTL